MTFKTAFSGFGGQGVLMMGYLLALAAMNQGRNVTYLPAYGAEVRGGTANCTVVVSDDEIASPVASSPDLVVAMNNPSVAKYENMVRPGGYLFVNSSLVHQRPTRTDIEVVDIPASEIAHELGSDRTANMIMMGAVAAKSKIVPLDAMKAAMAQIMAGKKQSIIELNQKGMDLGAAKVEA
ncbi:MAG: 2-oxoacid:acceptor oxidoreductase family protein [Proteobacteria bacterium]|nr:2-oxoacid:acceptor oxidoreductase family protein [Pseudomonadota bacterium]